MSLQPLVFIDYGGGSGLSTMEILHAYPRATIHFIEPATEMVALARSRLASVAAQVTFYTCTIENAVTQNPLLLNSADVVLSNVTFVHHILHIFFTCPILTMVCFG